MRSFTEAYKILFFYYKDNGSYISYAKNKNNKCYKVTFNEIVHIEEVEPFENGNLCSFTTDQEVLISQAHKLNEKNLHQLLFDIAKELMD